MKSLLIKLIIALIISLSIYFSFFYTFNPKKNPQSIQKLEALKIWEQQGAPDFEIPQLGLLSKIEAPIKIVHFWASWCGPCIEELPSLKNLAETLKNDIIILAISIDTNENDMKLFLQEQKINSINNLYFIFDGPSKNFSKSYLVDKIPDSYILKNDLKLVKRILGEINWVTPESLDFFQKIKINR